MFNVQYKIKPLEWIQNGERLISVDLQPFVFMDGLPNYQIQRDGVCYMLIRFCDFSPKDREEVPGIDSLEMAKDIANKHWHVQMQKILSKIVPDLTVIDHCSSWINSKEDIDAAIERLYYETNKRVSEDALMMEIQMFSNGLITEGKKNMALSEYRSYFFNKFKKKLLNPAYELNGKSDRNR